MNFWLVLSAIGSIASLVGLLLPIQGNRQRLVHVAYGLAVTLFATVAVWYWNENQRTHKVEQAATVLLLEADREYSTEGFIQAALAFLEKNRDLYPDSYARANELCKLNNCLGAQWGVTYGVGMDHEANLRNVSSALRGLIRGISTLETGS